MTKSRKSYSATSVPRLRAEVDKQTSPAYVWSMLSPSTCPFPEKGPTWMEMYNAKFPTTRASRPDYTWEKAEKIEKAVKKEPRKNVDEESIEEADSDRKIKGSNIGVSGDHLLLTEMNRVDECKELTSIAKFLVGKIVRQVLVKNLVEEIIRRTLVQSLVEESLRMSLASCLTEDAIRKAQDKVIREELQKHVNDEPKTYDVDYDGGMCPGAIRPQSQMKFSSEKDERGVVKAPNQTEQMKHSVEEHDISEESDKIITQVLNSSRADMKPLVKNLQIPGKASNGVCNEQLCPDLKITDETPLVAKNTNSTVEGEKFGRDKKHQFIEDTDDARHPSGSWMKRLSRAKPWQKYLIAGGIAVTVVGVSVILAKKFKS